MTEQAPTDTETDTDELVTVADKPREPTEYERTLRAAVRKAQAAARSAAAERDAAATAAAAERDAAIAAVRDESNGRLIRAELKAHAIKAGIVDLDVLRLMDVSALRMDDAGDVQGAAEAVEAFKASKPHLFGQAAPTGAQTGSTAHAGTTPPASKPGAADARTMSQAEYAALKASLTGGRR